MTSRSMSVAGSFYPAQCSQINQYIDSFNHALPEKEALGFRPRAIISPHAGYVYSGFTANAAYSRIDPAKIQRVIVIGPSHRVYLKGASVALYDNYQSPCMDLPMDREYSKALVERYPFFHFDPSAHSEHSTETQVPFIGHYFHAVKLVEIVYGDIDYTDLVHVIEDALRDESSFVVISTDLSHFYTLEEANLLDALCLSAVEEMDLQKLDSGCEACGMIGVKALMKAAKQQGMQSRLIDYRTSYEASADANRVVGYMSALIG